jgi:hypothetical protein
MESLSLDQVFIKSMTKVGKVKPPKDAMPICVVALGLMEIKKGILVFGSRPLFRICYLFSEMEDPFMQIVGFRIFGEEVSPKSSFDKSPGLFPLGSPLQSLNNLSIFHHGLGGETPLIHLHIRGTGEIDSSERLLANGIGSERHGLKPIQVFSYQFEETFQPTLFIDRMVRVRPDPEFLTIIGKNSCARGPSKLREIFQGFFRGMERNDVPQSLAPWKNL